MRLTILTTTYNRIGLLHRCFESLTDQAEDDFEWFVVDDGSTDETTRTVQEWQREAKFPIRLLSKENGGKHTALNAAIKEPLGDYVLFLDSDDALAPGAIQRLKVLADECDQLSAAGIIGNRHALQDGGLVGSPIPPEVSLTTGRELRERYGVTGDTLRVYQAKILRRYPLPHFEGEQFLPENIMFDQIDAAHRVLAAREVLYLCDYRPDGLSARILSHRAHSPHGFAVSLESSAWISRNSWQVVRYTLKYQVWSRRFFGNYGRAAFRRRVAYYVCLPAAELLYRLRKPAFIFDSYARARPDSEHL